MYPHPVSGLSGGIIRLSGVCLLLASGRGVFFKQYAGGRFVQDIPCCTVRQLAVSSADKVVKSKLVETVLVVLGARS